MNRITSPVRSVFQKTYRYGKGHPRSSAALVILVLVLSYILISQGDSADTPSENVIRTAPVELVSVAALSQDSEPIVVVGEVRSASQAELRFERGGQVINVYAQPGQYVNAGAVLAEVENAQERAGVLTAQGALAAAEAQLAKVRAGARTEDRASATAQAQGSAETLASAETSAQNAYVQAYTVAYNTIHAQTDSFFKNSYTVRPTFRITTATYDERTALEQERVALAEVLAAWQARTLTPIPAQELDARLLEAQDTLARIKTFVNTISVYVSKQELSDDLSAGEKAAQETTISLAQQSIDGAKSVTVGARTGLAQARTGATISQENVQTITNGARPEDIAAAEATVTQARGALQSALAVLADTRIITPISGTVSSLSVSRGDLAPAQQVVAVVANTNTREIEVYVSDQVRARISVGAEVLIQGTARGTVRTVSPGLDPVTKKARVIIAVDQDPALVQGAYTEIAFLPAQSDTHTAPIDHALYVPLTALKVTPLGLAVFTVAEDQTLVAHTVTEGPIVGARMRITDGVTPDMRIVRDVRGLAAGDRVSVATIPDTTSE